MKTSRSFYKRTLIVTLALCAVIAVDVPIYRYSLPEPEQCALCELAYRCHAPALMKDISWVDPYGLALDGVDILGKMTCYIMDSEHNAVENVIRRGMWGTEMVEPPRKATSGYLNQMTQRHPAYGLNVFKVSANR